MTLTKTGDQRAHLLNSSHVFTLLVFSTGSICKSEDKSATMKLLCVVMLVLVAAFADEDDDKKENVGTVVGIDLGTTYSW